MNRLHFDIGYIKSVPVNLVPYGDIDAKYIDAKFSKDKNLTERKALFLSKSDSEASLNLNMQSYKLPILCESECVHVVLQLSQPPSVKWYLLVDFL